MIAMTLPLNLQTNKVTFILRAPTLQFVVRTDAKTRAVHKNWNLFDDKKGVVFGLKNVSVCLVCNTS